ncbi:hypothetical protein [Streptomyces sp. NPDC096033]|uniref:hypothetical protein n=1 Tax=Streptomyces sp. NPDC096033 TaxID=3366071 RepID=UPI0037FA09D6
MSVGEWAALIGAAGSVLGGGGLFVGRATVKAARATAAANEAAARLAAEPAMRAEDLKVLQATMARVDEENGSLRGRLHRLEVLVRAFSSYVGQLTGQMRSHGVEPPAPPDAVDEYNRTGV